MDILLVKDLATIKQMEPAYGEFLKTIGGLEEEYYSIECIEASIESFNKLGASLFLFLFLKTMKLRLFFLFN